MDYSFCMQCQKAVPAEAITYLWTGKVKRRMCENCKNRAMDRKAAERKRHHVPLPIG